MPHQNAHLIEQSIDIEVAVPVGDSWIYCTMPFLVLPQPGNRIWLKTDIVLTVDRVEFIHNGKEPPFITIATNRVTMKDRDTYINFLNEFGFRETSSFDKHVE